MVKRRNRDDDDDYEEVSRPTTVREIDTVSLAKDIRKLFAKLCSVTLDRWDDLAITIKNRWVAVAEVWEEIISNQIEMPWKSMASKGYEQLTGEKYNDAPELLQVIWEALARHTVNLLFAEDSDEVRDAEKFDWLKWVAQRSGVIK